MRSEAAHPMLKLEKLSREPSGNQSGSHLACQRSTCLPPDVHLEKCVPLPDVGYSTELVLNRSSQSYSHQFRVDWPSTRRCPRSTLTCDARQAQEQTPCAFVGTESHRKTSRMRCTPCSCHKAGQHVISGLSREVWGSSGSHHHSK